MIVFWSGKAVSENDRLLPGKGRWRSSLAYKGFKESVAWALRAEHLDKPPIEGSVSVRLLMYLNADMDAANVIKPVLDAIELARVVKNDKQIRTFWFHREDTEKGEDDWIGIMIQEVK